MVFSKVFRRGEIDLRLSHHRMTDDFDIRLFAVKPICRGEVEPDQIFSRLRESETKRERCLPKHLIVARAYVIGVYMRKDVQVLTNDDGMEYALMMDCKSFYWLRVL